MTPDRWESVKRLFHEALELPAAERPEFLSQAAAHDPDLADEVRALLAAETRGERVFGGVAKTSAVEGLTPGTRLGPYEIERMLGAGGMGEVYKARDTRLDRTVAIKVLPSRSVRDAALRTRLQREARAISSLNHPQICTLYDIGEQDGLEFLVMEYLEGESLADRLAAGALPLSDALQCAIEIARALVAAHQRGIIHRDLKPANVMLTAAGAKLLDFGIAKLRDVAVSDEAPTAAPPALTREGMIVGTPQYCAPEQLEGKPIDGRTDIFAFGLVLYEMVTGRKAFEAASRAGLIAAILDREPPSLRDLQPAAPPWLEAFLARCLAKQPADRWSSSAELLARLAEGIGQPPAGPLDRRRVGPAVWIGAGVVALLIGVIALVAIRARWTPVLTERDTILLADFVNTTGEVIFDDTLKHALALHLEQSPFLGIVPDQQVRETLQFMQRSPDERVAGDVAREICQRRGIKALLSGGVQRLGSGYVVDLTASNCVTGETLARDQAEAATREDILPAIGDAGSRLREKLGESLGSIQRYDVPIEQVTTASLDALRAFVLGEQERMKSGDRDAIPFYKRAIELDPDFALAYHRLALMYRNAGESQLDARYAREAFDRRDRVSERERLYIEARYYYSVTGELQKVLETHRVLAATYTRDWSAANNLGVNLGQIGRHEEALEARLEALRRAPDNPLVQTNVAWTHLKLNRFDEAQKQFADVVARGQRVTDARRGLYLMAFLHGDRAAMEQHRVAGRGAPLLFTLARASASAGAWREAQGLYRRAVAAAGAESNESAAQITADRAVIAAFFGHHTEAVQEARSAAAMSKNPHAIWSAALAMALSGASADSQPLIDGLASEYPVHTLIQNVGLSSARAAQELGRGRPSAALAQLAPAEPYELGDWPWYGPTCLSIYLKGQAHLALGAAREAADEFQRIVDHRGLTAGSPLWPLAHLGLGRAHAAAGDLDRARQAYDAFLGMWKNADPDVPILREARAERDRLVKPS